MVYRRKFRRRFKRKAKVAKKVRAYVSKALRANIEDKHSFQTTAGGGTFDNTVALGIGGFCSFIAQGIGSNQRIGEQIKVTKWRLGLEFAIVQNVVTDIFQDTQVRVIMYRLKVKQATTPVIPLGAGSSTGLLYDNGVSKAILSPWNPDTVPSMYEILHDKTYRIDIDATAAQDKSLRTFTITKTFRKPKLCQFEHASGNVNKGDIFCYMYTNVLNPLKVGYQYSSMLYYEDA